MRLFGEKVHNEQVEQLYANLKISSVAIVVIASIMTIMLTNAYESHIPLGWLTVLTLINFYRYWLAVSFDTKTCRCEKFYKRFLLLLMLSSLTFGSIFLLFMPPSQLHQLFMLMFFGGIVSGGAVQTAYTKTAIRLFLVSMITPVLIAFVLYHDPLHYTVAVGLFFYLLFMYKIGINIYSHYTEALRLQKLYTGLTREFLVNKQRMAHLFHNTPIGVFYYNENFVVTYLNDYLAKEIIGVPKEKIEGLDLRKIKDQRILPALKEGIETGYGRYEGGYKTTLSDKELFIDLIASKVMIDQNHIEGLGVIINLTNLKNAQKKIEFLAYYDELTHLPKRSVIIEEIEKVIASAKRRHNYSALLYFDLDKFKDVNDSLGHNIGDKLLQHIAKTAQKVLRQEDIIARMGGDEFAVLLPMLSNEESEALRKAYEVAQRLLEAVEIPVSIEGIPFENTLSLGIVLVDENSKGAYEVIKAADNAMYKAKRSAKEKIIIFDEKLKEEITHKYRMKERIQKALKEHRFSLVYQPKFDRSGHIVSAEALLRWRDTEEETLYPDSFLPVAMEFNMMEEITFEAIDILRNDLQHLPKKLHVSLNISGSDIYSQKFITYLKERLAGEASRVELELTEQILIAETDEAIKNMTMLHDEGFLFSIDDFGTGYSSLSYLKRFPVDYIKIDKSFVLDMLQDRSDYDIVKTIIAITKSLGLHSIAEGVETKEHFEALKEAGCDYFQGYYFARPMTLEDLLYKLKQS